MTVRALLRSVTAAVAGTVVLAGCFTGERPTLSEGPALTGDAAADAVVERLGVATTATFSADFSIATTQQPPATASAYVVQDGPSDRSVTIGTAHFIVSGSESATCDIDTAACVPSVDEARVSDLLVTSTFYGASQANRLRTDVRLRTGETVASTETIAGRTATCVTIPVAATSSTYCALDNGVLARLVAADLSIEMTAYDDAADPAEFVIPPI